jgi:serine-type D-Ala-D-Ala carboxypeptidase (penicillin-binding protein 5/6)
MPSSPFSLPGVAVPFLPRKPVAFVLGLSFVVILAGPAQASVQTRIGDVDWLVPQQSAVSGGAPKVTWPVKGRARIAVPGVGTMGNKDSGVKSVPIASVTKVMTAYTILSDHPLRPGQEGPSITVTKAEADSYPRRKAEGESLVKVRAGLKISQREALEALLIRSGNNMADILGRWSAGSPKKFVGRMNEKAAELGLTSTSFADTSGLSSKSRSSAIDLLDLAVAAMRDKTFAQIVATPRAKIPMNTLTTTNKLLGRNGVVGIKTGSTNAAGGCLLWAATDRVGSETYTIYGVMLGAPGPLILTNALRASEKMVISARKALRRVTLVKRGTPVLSVIEDDGTRVEYGVASTVAVTGWSGMKFRLGLPPDLAPGETPTSITVKTGGDSIGVPLERL